MKTKAKYWKLKQAINTLWLSCIITTMQKFELENKLEKEYSDIKK